MSLAPETIALLDTARQLAERINADAVVLLTETALDWDLVLTHLSSQKLLVASTDPSLIKPTEGKPGITILELDDEPTATPERMSAALLKAIANEKLRPGAHVVLLYNGIALDQDRLEPLDSVSILHLDEHLEKLTARDLRRLETQVPLETLRLVVDLAAEIGREGREGKPVGTLFVVGDTRKVLKLSRPINFNPFRGYNKTERDLRDRRVREQIKDLAQLDGAILISRDGYAEAACMYLDVPAEGITISKGLGSRHLAAAAISRKTQAIAVCVSQSSGTVRLFQRGEVMLHIEPLARPHIWQPFHLEHPEANSKHRRGDEPLGS
jgi:DNA integrity scanning protein DisA with diadenylate cyclase activity